MKWLWIFYDNKHPISRLIPKEKKTKVCKCSKLMFKLLFNNRFI